jgi:NAD(P)-dependent dehydrogenase (short-subunit alcohol dehydrogenase family)
MMNVNLAGQCALVTGAAQGIGQAIAATLTANGARVAYADIDFASVQKTAASAPHSLALEMDISNELQVAATVAAVLKQFGRIDILVNNAGINTAKHRVNINQFPLDEWERIVKVDLTGTYLVSRAVAEAMIRQRAGRIINIASVLGVVPARLQCAFIAAKAGVVHLTRSTAIELAEHGILVNCVAPGSTLTEGTKQLFYSDNAAEKDRARRMLSHVPLGRPGTVEEIAHAVLFFAAPESTYITGQTLCVDGGWTAGGFFRDF